MYNDHHWRLKDSLTTQSHSARLSQPSFDYEAGDVPVITARLQEFFGCRETPLLCGHPLMLHLLSPAGRPVQITQDLDGF
jgi:ATP-dependent helicase HrpB